MLAWNATYADDTVLCDGHYQSFGAVMDAKRQVSPSSATNWRHTLVNLPKTSKAKHFECKVQKVVSWAMEGSQVDDGKTRRDLSAVGTYLKVAEWTTDYSSVVWSVKWHTNTEKGLVPVKPVVVLTCAVNLDPKTGCELVC